MKQNSQDFMVDVVNSDPGLTSGDMLIIGVTVILLLIIVAWIIVKK